MKLIVPHVGELHPADARLLRLAEFLGAESELFPLEADGLLCENLIDRRVGHPDSCLVINPPVLSPLFPDNTFLSSLASSLLKRFSFLLVHNLRQDTFSASTISALSGGRLRSVVPIERADLTYCCAPSTEEICAQFSGVQFGPTHPASDQVFVQTSAAGVRSLITIEDRPFFASTQSEKATVFFLGGTEITDIDALWNGKALTESFSGLLPPAMALRSIFGKECWRPNRSYATLLIDDPLLRKNYGFLNYQRALRLMDEHNFHTTIAFIPHNFRRTSRAIARMFRERADRYSICFHGNDHTNAEFAAKDANLVNTMLIAAEARMKANRESTGIQCDNVMVFPQGNFSRSAMEALNAHNFSAAVNTVPYPLGEALKLTIADVSQPAVLKYAGFPLFLRKYVRQISSPEIAFNIFFGRPLFIAEHHTIFKDPEPLIELVARVHSIAPDIRWASVREAIENAWLKRHAGNGTVEIRSFSNVARVENPSNLALSCSVEWPDRNHSFIEKVFVDAVACRETRVESTSVRADSELAPGQSRLFSLVHRNSFGFSGAHNGPQWAVKAFLRRRLSEIRDNYLSKNEQLLSLAKFLQRRLHHKGGGPEEALGT